PASRPALPVPARRPEGGLWMVLEAPPSSGARRAGSYPRTGLWYSCSVPRNPYCFVTAVKRAPHGGAPTCVVTTFFASLFARSAVRRLLDLLHDATEIVALRRLQWRKLLERLQVL